MNLRITFAVCASLLIAPAFSQDAPFNPAGKWLGTLDAGAMKLRILIEFFPADSGFTGTMNSIDQGAIMPLETVTIDGPSVAFAIPSLNGGYSGEHHAESGEIRGTWTQAGAVLALNLTHVDAAPVLLRPQEPKGELPYQAIEVALDNAGTHLAGTLTVPAGEGPFPAVLLISGSGQQDRDEAIMGHRPFLVVSDFLTRNGFAVLRLDDRGVGGSTGDVEKATTETFATDTAAGVRFLLSRPESDDTKVGLIGHSEGALIAPIVAAENPNVAFVILLAGPAVSGDLILARQSELIARAGGMGETVIARTQALSAELYTVLRGASDQAAARVAIATFYNDLSEFERTLLGYTEASKELLFRQLTSDWFRAFLAYDPKTHLQRLRCPVLALYGEKDLQVPPDQNADRMRAIFTSAPTRDFTVDVLPGLNHLFQTATTGSPSEYGQIEETFSPLALERIKTWLNERFPGS